MYTEFMKTKSQTHWETRFCPTPWCDADRLLVKPHPEQPDAWWVTEGEDRHPWLVARKVPICPLCGESLLTAANADVQLALLPGSQIQW